MRSKPEHCRLRAAPLAVAVALAALGPGCYFLSRGGTSGGDAGPCDGSACDSSAVDGCVPGMEVCNGLDDDCNGMVDEGFDLDGDGFTPCGGGEPSLVDCDDGDPLVHPGTPESPAVEQCDGKDNDCDGTVDEASPAPLCRTDETCVGGLGCVIANCAVPGMECPVDMHCDLDEMPAMCKDGSCELTPCLAPAECDPVTRTCVVMLPDGSPCRLDSECTSSVCAPVEATGLGTSGGVCARACCNDLDCVDGTVCWPATSGARLCLGPPLLEIERGPGGDGAACSAGAECASGVCAGARGCLANCAADDDCDSRTCTALTLSRDGAPFAQLACAEPGGSSGYGAVAVACRDLSCASGLCLPTGPFSAVCTAPCRTGADCPDVVRAPLATLHMRCGQVRFVATPGTMQACIMRDHDGAGRTGDACGDRTDCLDDLCFRDDPTDAAGRCADTCCSDVQCPPETHCRPTLVGSGTWQMRCR